jgi:hypothetical protein
MEDMIMRTMINFLMDLNRVPESFNNIRFDGGHFAGSGAMYNNCEIISGLIERGTFNNCYIKDVDLAYIGATFNNCIFEECYGTKEEHMRFSEINNCQFVNCIENYRGEGECDEDDWVSDDEFDHNFIDDSEDYDEDYINLDDHGTYYGHYIDEEGAEVSKVLDRFIYMDRLMGEDGEIYEPDWKRGNYTTYMTEDEKYSYTFTDSDIERMAIAIAGIKDGVEIFRIMDEIAEEILDREFARMRKEEAIVEVPKEEPVMVPNSNMVIAKIQEQMIKAIEECDFETYDKLEERLNRLNK